MITNQGERGELRLLPDDLQECLSDIYGITEAMSIEQRRDAFEVIARVVSLIMRHQAEELAPASALLTSLMCLITLVTQHEVFASPSSATPTETEAI
jgi:hypothetical protein